MTPIQHVRQLAYNADLKGLKKELSAAHNTMMIMGLLNHAIIGAVSHMGDVETIDYLIAYKMKRHTPYLLANLAYLKACEAGNIDMIKYLQPKTQLKNIEPIFMAACRAGHEEAITYLFNEFKEWVEPLGAKAYNTVAACGHIEALRMLPSLFDVSQIEFMAVRQACMAGHLTVAKHLIGLRPDLALHTFKSACLNEERDLAIEFIEYCSSQEIEHFLSLNNFECKPEIIAAINSIKEKDLFEQCLGSNKVKNILKI